MTAKPSKKVGRPRAEVDPTKVEALAALQCTKEEIASGLGISLRTLERRMNENEEIVEAIKRGRERGRMSLRRMQYEAAKNGNVTMQIWLGKQWLGQKDKHEIGMADKIKIEVEYVDSQGEGKAQDSAPPTEEVHRVDGEA